MNDDLPPMPEPSDIAEAFSKALRRAYHLGQTYRYAQNSRADDTKRKFEALESETRDALFSHCREVAQAAEIERLHALLERCRPFIESDVQMIADISRHAPLDAASQAVHDSTEYPSERLLRDILATLGPNANITGG